MVDVCRTKTNCLLPIYELYIWTLDMQQPSRFRHRLTIDNCAQWSSRIGLATSNAPDLRAPSAFRQSLTVIRLIVIGIPQSGDGLTYSSTLGAWLFQMREMLQQAYGNRSSTYSTIFRF